jgi:hypothetical protein
LGCLWHATQTAPTPLFFTEKGSTYKTFGRAPPEELEPKPESCPTKEALAFECRNENSLQPTLGHPKVGSPLISPLGLSFFGSSSSCAASIATRLKFGFRHSVPRRPSKILNLVARTQLPCTTSWRRTTKARPLLHSLLSSS